MNRSVFQTYQNLLSPMNHFQKSIVNLRYCWRTNGKSVGDNKEPSYDCLFCHQKATINVQVLDSS